MEVVAEFSGAAVELLSFSEVVANEPDPTLAFDFLGLGVCFAKTRIVSVLAIVSFEALARIPRLDQICLALLWSTHPAVLGCTCREICQQINLQPV